ncbi:MAG: hypothetical protein HY720_26310 [Planctomycetes bacterium]|nr:hypothetical protein [Planctomycetota bacterium]
MEKVAGRNVISTGVRSILAAVVLGGAGSLYIREGAQPEPGSDFQGGLELLLEVPKETVGPDDRDDLAERTARAFRKRLAQAGVGRGASVAVEGDGAAVRLPGAGDDERREALDLLAATGILELRVAADEDSTRREWKRFAPIFRGPEVDAAVASYCSSLERDGVATAEGRQGYRWYLVRRGSFPWALAPLWSEESSGRRLEEPRFDSTHFDSVAVEPDEGGDLERRLLTIHFKKDDAIRLEKFMREKVGRTLLFLWGDRVVWEAEIDERIPGGEIRLAVPKKTAEYALAAMEGEPLPAAPRWVSETAVAPRWSDAWYRLERWTAGAALALSVLALLVLYRASVFPIFLGAGSAAFLVYVTISLVPVPVNTEVLAACFVTVAIAVHTATRAADDRLRAGASGSPEARRLAAAFVSGLPLAGAAATLGAILACRANGPWREAGIVLALGGTFSLFGQIFGTDALISLFVRSSAKGLPGRAWFSGADPAASIVVANGVLAAALVLAGGSLAVTSEAGEVFRAVALACAVLAPGSVLGEIVRRCLGRAESVSGERLRSNPKSARALITYLAIACGLQFAVGVALYLACPAFAERLRREAISVPAALGSRTIPLPLDYPYGPPGRDARGRLVPARGLSYTVETPQGEHVLAMIPQLALDEELALAQSEEERARSRTLRERYRASGLFTNGPEPSLVWELSSYAYQPDPDWVVLPSGGRYLVLFEPHPPYPPDLGFYRDGEGVGQRALERLGRGGVVGSAFSLALDDERKVLLVSIPSMGEYELDIAAGGDVVASREGVIAEVDQESFLFAVRWLAVGLFSVAMLILDLVWIGWRGTGPRSQRSTVENRETPG